MPTYLVDIIHNIKLGVLGPLNRLAVMFLGLRTPYIDVKGSTQVCWRHIFSQIVIIAFVNIPNKIYIPRPTTYLYYINKREILLFKWFVSVEILCVFAHSILLFTWALHGQIVCYFISLLILRQGHSSKRGSPPPPPLLSILDNEEYIHNGLKIGS